MVIAEIDEKTGKDAEDRLKEEFGADQAIFVKTNVDDENDVKRLGQEACRTFGKVDAVLNNATAFTMGAVKDNPWLLGTVVREST